MAVSAAFTFTGAAGSLLKRAVAAATSFTATLDNLAGVITCEWEIVSTDDTTSAASYTLALSGPKNSVVTSTSLTAGTAGLLHCIVNRGRPDEARATAKFGVLTAGGLWVGCFDEEMEHDPQFGSTPIMNAAARAAGVGGATSATLPIRITAGDVSIDPATASDPGSMSEVDKGILDDAHPGDVDDVAGTMSNRLVVRDSNGVSRFQRMSVGQYIEFGVTADGHYSRVGNITPAAARQMGFEASGRATVYADGALRGVPTFYDVPQVGELAKEADAAPGDPMAERTVFTGSPYDIPSGHLLFWPDDDLVADDVDYAEFTIRVRDGAGSPPDIEETITTETTGTGDWTANIVVQLLLLMVVPAGAIVTVQMTKPGGTGVEVPAGKFSFFGRRAT